MIPSKLQEPTFKQNRARKREVSHYDLILL